MGVVATKGERLDDVPRAFFPGGFTILMAGYGRDDPGLFRRAVDSVYQNTILPDD